MILELWESITIVVTADIFCVYHDNVFVYGDDLHGSKADPHLSTARELVFW